MLLLLVMMMTRMVDAGVRHVSDRYALAPRDHRFVDGQDGLRVDSDPRHLKRKTLAQINHLLFFFLQSTMDE